MTLGFAVNAWRIALWLEMCQRANSWRAVWRNPVTLAGYGVALVLFFGLVALSVWISTAAGDSAQQPPSPDEFTNLCLIALMLLRVIEGMLTADFALEAQHGLTHMGVGIVAFLGALSAGGLQLLALSWGGVGGALVLLGLIGLTLAVIRGLFELAAALWRRL